MKDFATSEDPRVQAQLDRLAKLSLPQGRLGLDTIRELRKQDVSVIIVSHNMQQLMSVADRITVMRLGRSIATRTVKDTQVSEIVGLITGAIPGDADAAAATPIPA